MSVHLTSQSTAPCTSSIFNWENLNLGRYSLSLPSLPTIVNNANKLAMLTLGLYAISNIPTVEAGPLAYAVCVSGCEMSFTQAALVGAVPSGGWSFLALIAQHPFCATLCAPALAAPSP